MTQKRSPGPALAMQETGAVVKASDSAKITTSPSEIEVLIAARVLARRHFLRLPIAVVVAAELIGCGR
jgi:hypothetical protein